MKINDIKVAAKCGVILRLFSQSGKYNIDAMKMSMLDAYTAYHQVSANVVFF